MSGDIWAALAARCRQPLEPVCSCPDIDVTNVEERIRGEYATVKGWAETCPVHGPDGTAPTFRRPA